MSNPLPSGLLNPWENGGRNLGIVPNPPIHVHQQRTFVGTNNIPPWQTVPAGQTSQQPATEGKRKRRQRIRPKHKNKKVCDSFTLDPVEVSSWASSRSINSPGRDSLAAGPAASDNHDQASVSSADSASLNTSMLQDPSDSSVNKPDEHNTSSANPGVTNSDDFGLFLNTKDYSDITLVTDADREFYAHKIILAARSSYFAETFKENQDAKSRIEITNVRGDIFEQVLKFIYTGKVNILENDVSELSTAAERFALHGLKSQCTEYLIRNVNTDSAAKLLIMSSANNMPELKKKCISYINSYPHEVIETEEYKNLVPAHPTLLDELYRDLVDTVYPTHFLKQ